MLGKYTELVRKKAPLIHNITNYVTINDCANILLACGASPVMSESPAEAEDVTSLCSGLVINMGMLSESKLEAMLLAGKRSNELGHTVVLDPVGVGASRSRTEAAQRLLKEVRFDAIRGNASEIRSLCQGIYSTKGVDADSADEIRSDNITQGISIAKSLSYKTGAAVIITGEKDIAADSTGAYIIENGSFMMSRITGAGCMLSAMLCAYLAASDNRLEAAAAAAAAMGVCGEAAERRMSTLDGNASFRNYLIDAVFRLTGQQLDEKEKIKGAF